MSGNRTRRTAVVVLLIAVAIALSGGATAEEAGVFEVEITELNESVTEGDRVVAEATVTNVGEGEDSQQIHLKNFDGEIVDSIAQPPLTLTPGESQTVTLAWETQRGDAGTGEARVASDNEYPSQTVTIQEAPELTAAFDHEPETPAVNQNVTFDAGDSGSTVEGYRWDFTGDGEFDANTSDPEHNYTFEEAGDHVITLVVEDATGDTDEMTRTITVVEAVRAEADEASESSSSSGGSSSTSASFTDTTDSIAVGPDRVTVRVTPEAADIDEDDVQRAFVRAAADTGASIEVELSDGDRASTAELQAIVEHVEVEVADDVDVGLAIHQSSSQPTSNASEFEPEDGTLPAGYVHLETSLDPEHVERAQIDFRLSQEALESIGEPEHVALYHLDEETGEWETLPTDVVEETDDAVRFSAEIDSFSQFVVGIDQAQFDVADVFVDGTEPAVGDTVEFEVPVTNTGAAEGTFTAELWIDDELVDEETLTIEADSTREVTFVHEFADQGSHEVRVNDVSIGPITVTSAPDDDPDDATRDESANDDSEQELTRADTVPGFGLAAALVAVLLGIATLLWRRR